MGKLEDHIPGCMCHRCELARSMARVGAEVFHETTSRPKGPIRAQLEPLKPPAGRAQAPVSGEVSTPHPPEPGVSGIPGPPTPEPTHPGIPTTPTMEPRGYEVGIQATDPTPEHTWDWGNEVVHAPGSRQGMPVWLLWGPVLLATFGAGVAAVHLCGYLS